MELNRASEMRWIEELLLSININMIIIYELYKIYL